MKPIERIRPVVRLLAAAIVFLAVVLAAPSPAPAGAVQFGGCRNSPANACATSGGATADRKCDPGAEDCTTCAYSSGDTCYHGSGPHIQHYYPHFD